MKISVVIPVYNEAEVIEACLQSLKNQTRPADEIIIVDNNSTDTTAAIAAATSAKVITEKNQGIWAASSTGYNAATGDVITRCDADSILPPDWLAKIERHFNISQATGAVTGPGTFYDCSPFIARLADIFYMRAYFRLVGAALRHPPLFGSNFAMRRTSWESVRDAVHNQQENIHDDIDLSFHLGAEAIISYDPTLIAGISSRPFKHSGSMVTRYSKGFRSIFIHWPDDAPWNRKRR